MSRGKQHVVSGSSDTTVQIWHVATGKQVGDGLYDHDGWVRAVTISHDCRWFVSASYDKALRLWELSRGKMIGNPLVGHTNRLWSGVTGNDDQLVLSGSSDKTVWHLQVL